MYMINKAKYLSLLVLLGAWGCATNKNVSNSGGAYDDLYGGNPNSGLVTRNSNVNQDQEISRYGNPDYNSTQDDQVAGTSDYYDDSYLSSRTVGRALSSSDVGYNSGFVDGFNQASRFSNPYYNGLGSYWPGNSLSLSFGFGLGSMFRMRPYMGFGMGSMYSMGYSPWGFNSMMGLGSFGYDPFGYGPYGYSPYGSMYGYDSFYGYGGGYGYGYNPYAYSRPVIVVNNVYDRQGLTRSYGPRTANSSRSSDRYNSGFVNNPRSGSYTGSDRGSRRSANAVAGGDSYSSPRSSSRSSRGAADSYSGGRSNAAAVNGSGYSRGTSEGNNVYYSRPRSSSSSNYTPEGTSSGNYSSPRAARGNSGSTYTVPSRSESNYSSPSRSTNSYSSPGRSTESYSAPARTYSAPTYSAPAPSRSYSAPASSGGGASRSSGRGPR